jgi:hypothetical protein
VLTEDYLMRQINLALAVLARALGLKTAGQYQAAHTVLDQMLEELFGLHAGLIKQLDDRSLFDALTSQGTLDNDRLMIAAELFLEKGELFELQKNDPESYWQRLRALNFYLEAALSGGPANFPDPREKIQALSAKLDSHALPAETLFSLFSYHELAGDYARAGQLLDRLAALPSLQEEMLGERAAFYGRLVEKSDSELARGNLTRAEVEARLKQS